MYVKIASDWNTSMCGCFFTQIFGEVIEKLVVVMVLVGEYGVL